MFLNPMKFLIVLIIFFEDSGMRVGDDYQAVVPDVVSSTGCIYGLFI